MGNGIPTSEGMLENLTGEELMALEIQMGGRFSTHKFFLGGLLSLMITKFW